MTFCRISMFLFLQAHGFVRQNVIKMVLVVLIYSVKYLRTFSYCFFKFIGLFLYYLCMIRYRIFFKNIISSNMIHFCFDVIMHIFIIRDWPSRIRDWPSRI